MALFWITFLSPGPEMYMRSTAITESLLHHGVSLEPESSPRLSCVWSWAQSEELCVIQFVVFCRFGVCYIAYESYTYGPAAYGESRKNPC